jgi:outer membrane protein assembly factor BamB
VTTDPGDGSLHATPTLVWDRPSDSAYIPTGLTIDSEGMLYVILWGYKGNDRSILVKIDPETREWLWELELVGEDEDSIGVSDSHCIMVVDEPGHPYDGHVALTLYGYSWRNSGFLYIDRATGAIVRQYRNIVTYHPPLLYDGKYYSDASNAELRCVDAETGAIVWKYVHDTPEGDLGGTPPVVYKGIVYMATQWGLISFDAATGNPLFVDPSADTDGFTYNSKSRMIVVGDLLIYSNLDTHQLFAVRMDVHARR